MCEFCSNKKSQNKNMVKSSKDVVLILRGSLIVDTSGYCDDCELYSSNYYEINIKYCPMCGQKLD